MTGIFDKYHKQFDAWYDRNIFAFLSELEAVRKALPKNGKGLEVGVGTGRFAAALGIAAGIDPSKNMIKVARERGVDASFGYGEDIPFKGRAFDYAVLIVTLCFAKDPQKVLMESARVLKKNGRIIIGIVDKKSFLGRSYSRKKGVFYKQARFFSVEQVTAMLREAGFGSFSYCQTISVQPDKMRSVEKPKKGFGRCGFVLISAKKM